MPRFAVLCVLLAGCEIAFPVVLDLDAEEAETKDAGSEESGDSAPKVEVPRDAAAWDHKIGS